MSNKLPVKHDIRFLLAEDIRQEILGKVSLQGFIPGEHFFVGGKPPVMPKGDATSNVAFIVPSLAFIFIITGGEGKFAGRLRVIAPDSKTAIIDMSSQTPIEKIPGKAAIFVTAAKPFVGPTFGTYRVQIQLDEKKFSFPMTIEKAPANLKSK